MEMTFFSLCVITMMMVKLQQSFYATYVEIYVQTVTDSFIFIDEPKLIKDRWRFLSLHTEQYLEHNVYSITFVGDLGSWEKLDLGITAAFALTNCVNQASYFTVLRLSFHIYKNRTVVNIKEKIGNIWNFLECLLNKRHYYWIIYTSLSES